MRKLAREAVIFMLLGPVVAFLVVFIFSERQSIGGAKARAAQAVYAVDLPPPPGYTVDNSVLVPLTNGVQLYVTDCTPAILPADWFAENAPKPKFDSSNPEHGPWENYSATSTVNPNKPHQSTRKSDIFDKVAAQNQKATTPVAPDMSKAQPIARPPGATNGSDCVYFSDSDQKYASLTGRSRLTAVPLGDVNQIAIEKEYWTAYAKAKHEMRTENALVAGFASLYGFPGGLLLWGFYRLVRFAVKG